MEAIVKPSTRFSGADWASELRDILVVGVGGIGSWTAFNLSRIGHRLLLIDNDTVEETNVTGGQMFRKKDIGKAKVIVIKDICREFGAESRIDILSSLYSEGMGAEAITITGLDNMKTRREVFNGWMDSISSLSAEERRESILIDGRLTMEMWEVLSVIGDDKEAIDRYEKEFLFSDDEAQLLDCTTKQSTFAAMGIAEGITSTLCNFLTNIKMKDNIRPVPFYERNYMPLKLHSITQEAVVSAPQTT